MARPCYESAVRTDRAATSMGALTALDWIGVVLVGLGASGLVALSLVGRAFAVMYADFGATEALPVATRLALAPWCPPLLAAATVLVLAGGLRPSASIGQRRAWIVGAFVFSLLGFALCLVGLYLPLFALAGSVE